MSSALLRVVGLHPDQRMSQRAARLPQPACESLRGPDVAVGRPARHARLLVVARHLAGQPALEFVRVHVGDTLPFQCCQHALAATSHQLRVFDRAAPRLRVAIYSARCSLSGRLPCRASTVTSPALMRSTSVSLSRRSFSAERLSEEPRSILRPPCWSRYSNHHTLHTFCTRSPVRLSSRVYVGW